MSDGVICSICKNPKPTEKSGSLTQWIVTCQCDGRLVESAQGVSISICSICGKRTHQAKPGSISQIIFQSEYCSCAALVQPGFIAGPTEEVWPRNEQELICDPKTFPVDRYKPLAILGSGAEGRVYLARDRLLDKKLALKILHRLDRRQLLAFQEQARVLSKLDHESLAKVLDFGVIESSSVPYMVIEYINGHSLQEIIAQEGYLSWCFAVDIFTQICDGLGYAHSHQIYYRDLKPANVLILQNNGQIQVCLIDPALPLAGEMAAELVGTPPYMSPDQALKRPHDARSEVYSVACMLFEALTGHPPFQGSTSLHTLKMHADESPPRVLLPDEPGSNLESLFTGILHRGLAKDPGERYQNMAEFKSALKDVRQQYGISQEMEPSKGELAGKEIGAPSAFKPKGRNILIGCLTFVVVVILGLASGLLGQRGPVVPSSDDSRISKRQIKPTLGESEYLDDLSKVEKWKPIYRDTGTIYHSSPFIEDVDFKLLKRYPNVRSIKVRASDCISGVGLADIHSLNLNSIEIQSSSISDAGLQQISSFKGMTVLSLGGSQLLTERGVSEISKLKELRILSLNDMKLPRNTLEVAASCPKLNRLEIELSRPFGKSDLLRLSSFPSLQSLSLRGLKLTSQDCKVICSLPLVINVDLRNNVLGDDGLIYLSRMPLMILDLSGNPVTDLALTKLEKLSKLQRLTIINCPAISERARAAFRKNHPRCALIEI